MKKLFATALLFSLIMFGGSSYANRYNAGDTFHHAYWIINNFPCSIKITKIEKCWYVSDIAPSGGKVFSKVGLRANIDSSEDSGCYTYDVDYTIPGNTTDYGWDINFYSNSNITYAGVHSSFQYRFDQPEHCRDTGSNTNAMVNDDVIGNNPEYCGDGIVQTSRGEECDEGALNGQPGHCSATCTNVAAPYCGDGIVQTGEECDEGSLNGQPGHCSATCTNPGGPEPYCGDSIVQTSRGEVCDEGSLNGQPGHCSATCTNPSSSSGPGTYCGDNIVQAGEECDEGSLNGQPGHCSATCTTSSSTSSGPPPSSTSTSSGPPPSSTSSSGITPYCGDGIVQSSRGEVCDDGSLNGTAGHCSSNCNTSGGPTTPPSNPPTFFPTPACQYTDPPSVQVGEYIPLWWKIKTGIRATDCSSSTEGKYNSNTVSCNFKIYNAKSQSMSWTESCFANYWPTLASSYRQDHIPTFNDPTGRTMKMINSSIFSYLGKFRFELNQVNYQRCEDLGDSYEWVSGTYNGTICSMDFAVTDKYLLQRGATVSTQNNSLLGNFFKRGPTAIIDASRLRNIQSSSYQGGDNLDYIFNDFVKKYITLAVKNGQSIPNLGISSLKKVADKEIYISEGSVVIGSNKSIPKNMTLIVKNGNLTITDNLSSGGGVGMFIVPNGTIKFETTNCDNQNTVEGIFFGKYFGTDRILNNNVNANWCDDGRLKIKGIVKGGNIDALINNKRSVLRNYTEDEIYNGASLLIDNNSSVWSNLPPGAKELLDKLQIYKK